VNELVHWPWLLRFTPGRAGRTYSPVVISRFSAAVTRYRRGSTVPRRRPHPARAAATHSRWYATGRRRKPADPAGSCHSPWRLRPAAPQAGRVRLISDLMLACRGGQSCAVSVDLIGQTPQIGEPHLLGSGGSHSSSRSRPERRRQPRAGPPSPSPATSRPPRRPPQRYRTVPRHRSRNVQAAPVPSPLWRDLALYKR
jgi:hypothetical protein